MAVVPIINPIEFQKAVESMNIYSNSMVKDTDYQNGIKRGVFACISILNTFFPEAFPKPIGD